MRYLFGAMIMWMMLIAFLIGVEKATANWYPVGKAGATKTYGTKDSCETKEGQECFDVTGVDRRYKEVQPSQQDDLTKPIFKAPYNVENCDSDTHCGGLMQAKEAECTNGDYSQYQKNAVLPGYTIYCTGVTGYEQKTVNVIVDNAALKTSVEAADAQKAADDAALAAVAADAAFGNRMIAYVGARVRSKSLNLTDTKQVLSDYSAVIGLLRAGSITHAKTEIEGLTPDGTRISQADKDALLAEINAYLGL